MNSCFCVIEQSVIQSLFGILPLLLPGPPLPHATGTRLGTRLGTIFFIFGPAVPRKILKHRIKNGLPGQKRLLSAAKTGTFGLFFLFWPTTGTFAFRYFRGSAGFLPVFCRFSAGKHLPSLFRHRMTANTAESRRF